MNINSEDILDASTAGKTLLTAADEAAQRTALGAAPLASPTFTGTVTVPAVTVSGAQVVGARKTGWSVASGTAARTTFATYAAPDISVVPTEAEVQAVADHVQILSQRLKALIDDLHQTAGHGLIGT